MRRRALPAKPGRRRVRAGIVLNNSIDSNQNRVRAGPQLHGKGAGGFARDPFRFPGDGGDFSVQGHGGLDRDKRGAAHDPVVERFVELPAFAGQDAVRDRKAGAPENAEAPSGVPGIGIGRAGHHPPDAGGDDRVRAGRRAALRATRFESDVERGAFGVVSAFLGVADGFNFRVRLPALPMPAPADDLPAPGQNGADQGIGRSPSISAARQAQGQTNELRVREHYLKSSIAMEMKSPRVQDKKLHVIGRAPRFRYGSRPRI